MLPPIPDPTPFAAKSNAHMLSGVSDKSLRLARKAADSLPSPEGLMFHSVPIEAFSLEQVRKMLATSQRQLDKERSDHVRSVEFLADISNHKAG